MWCDGAGRRPSVSTKLACAAVADSPTLGTRARHTLSRRGPRPRRAAARAADRGRARRAAVGTPRGVTSQQDRTGVNPNVTAAGRRARSTPRERAGRLATLDLLAVVGRWQPARSAQTQKPMRPEQPKGRRRSHAPATRLKNASFGTRRTRSNARPQARERRERQASGCGARSSPWNGSTRVPAARPARGERNAGEGRSATRSGPDAIRERGTGRHRESGCDRVRHSRLLPGPAGLRESPLQLGAILARGLAVQLSSRGCARTIEQVAKFLKMEPSTCCATGSACREGAASRLVEEPCLFSEVLVVITSVGRRRPSRNVS